MLGDGAHHRERGTVAAGLGAVRHISPLSENITSSPVFFSDVTAHILKQKMCIALLMLETIIILISSVKVAGEAILRGANSG